MQTTRARRCAGRRRGPGQQPRWAPVGAIASLDALPPVVEAAGDRGPILFDGGIRRGTDVLMALALGATAVGIAADPAGPRG